jgi:hypothetical protein
LLRTSHFYDTASMMQSYKSHILCLLEGATAAIYHASDSTLARLDALQCRFLRALNLTDSVAFLEGNLAPLGLRRDIAMLGLVYKCVNRIAHPDLCSLFTRAVASQQVRNTRTEAARHDLQLASEASTARLNIFRRSLFGLVEVWNLLPSDIVHAQSVSQFQSALTLFAKRLCKLNVVFWQVRFSPRSSHHVLMSR